jgi:hypothetical protein
MRTPLVKGQTFTDADNAPARNVVLIDQLLAEKAFPHQSAVGKRILIRTRTPESEWAMAVIVSVCFRVPAAHLVGHLRHPDFVVFLRFGFS